MILVDSEELEIIKAHFNYTCVGASVSKAGETPS